MEAVEVAAQLAQMDYGAVLPQIAHRQSAARMEGVLRLLVLMGSKTASKSKQTAACMLSLQLPHPLRPVACALWGNSVSPTVLAVLVLVLVAYASLQPVPTRSRIKENQRSIVVAATALHVQQVSAVC